MEISVKKSDQLSIVSIEGSIDALTADQVTTCLDEQIHDGAKNLLVDLAKVDFMSSVGLRVMLGALKETRKLGGDLCLACAQDGVARVLKMSGFTNLLEINDDIEKATAHFKA
jgi:anti-sigma B factor antagonist